MNIKYKENYGKSQYELFFLLSLFIIIISFFSAISNTTNIWDASKFALFQIGGVLIPGLALLKLFPIKYKTREEQLILAYVDGYVLSMAVYLFVMFFNLDKHAVLLYVGISIISTIIIIFRHKDEEAWSVSPKLDIMPWIFLAVLLFVSWLVFSMHWGVSLHTTEFNDDILFWIGDLISLDKNFLPMDFRYLSPGRKYHYGGAMQLAMVCKVTNISAFNVAVHYSYIQSMILLAFSAYCVGKRVLGDKRVVGLMLFLLFFSTGIENRSLVTYVWHIFIQPMSFNIAFSLELIILLLLILQIDVKKINYSILCRVALTMLTCTITKGPAGAIALCAIGVICVWWLLGKTEIKKSILYGIFSIVAFGVVFLFLADINSAYVIKETAENVRIEEQAVALSDRVIGNVEEEQEVDATVIVLESSEEERATSNVYFIREKVKNVILPILRYVLYVLCINPWTFIPAGIYFVYAVFRRKTELIHWVCALVLVIGTILGRSIDYVGKSQMYFALAVYPFAALLTGLGLREIILSEKFLSKYSVTIKRFCVILGCCFILICSGVGTYRNSLEQAIYVGMANLLQKDYQSMMVDTKYDKMVYSEYEAYEWIRLNTDENALFLSDRMLEENIESRIPGVFCERYIYRFRQNELESGRDCFAGNEECLLEYADKGVRYIIQNKSISPNFICTDNIAAKLYENQQIVVYELQDRYKWKNY